MAQSGKKPVSPIKAGLSLRCPICGKGKLFERYLKIAPKCDRCGEDFSRADPADGPAVFVTFIAGFLIMFGVLYVEVSYRPPIWVHMVIWLPLTILLPLLLLPYLKSLLVALQFHYRAEEARMGEDKGQE